MGQRFDLTQQAKSVVEASDSGNVGDQKICSTHTCETLVCSIRKRCVRKLCRRSTVDAVGREAVGSDNEMTYGLDDRSVYTWLTVEYGSEKQCGQESYKRSKSVGHASGIAVGDYTLEPPREAHKIGELRLKLAS